MRHLRSSELRSETQNRIIMVSAVGVAVKVKSSVPFGVLESLSV